MRSYNINVKKEKHLIKCNPTINTLIVSKNKRKILLREESIDQKIPMLTGFSLCLVQNSTMLFTYGSQIFTLIPKYRFYNLNTLFQVFELHSL